MRIVVGLRPLFPGKVGGLETYVRELLRAWGDTRREDEWIILVNAESAPTFTSPGPWMRFELGPPADDLRAWQLAAEKYQPAIYFSPMTVIDPPSVGLPAVVTIPDLQQLFFPQFYDAVSLGFRALHYPLSARRAAAILTLSAHAKQSIVEKLGVPPEKVHGILLAAGDAFRQRSSPSAQFSFRATHGLPERFGYFPANFWPHKNHATLFAALDLYRRRHGDPPHIALTGFAGEDAERVRRLIGRHGLDRHIHILGYLPAEELPVAYQSAHFLIFPSLFEGFGIPVAEAMASGCPVLTSNAASLPEFIGDSALTFDPARPGEIADQLHLLLTRPGLRESLIAKGLARSETLTWRHTAELTYDVFRRVHESLGTEHASRTAAIPLDAGGRIAAGQLPASGAGCVLYFLRPGSRVDPESARLAPERLDGSGLQAAFGAVMPEGGPGTPEIPRFDVVRLKSEDVLPLENLWVGPAAAPALLAWLKGNPDATAYEIVLWLANRGVIRELPGLIVHSIPIGHRPVTARDGARLSYRYFGVADRQWLRLWAEGYLARLGPLGRWIGRHATLKRRVLQFIAGLLQVRLTGRGPEGLRALPARALKRRSPAPPTIDGWIGNDGLVACSRRDNRLTLVLESPIWPMRDPPRIRIEYLNRCLYKGTLYSRGVYEFSWPWPDEREGKIQLRIRCSQAFIPAEHGMGDDGRHLALRVL